MFINFASMAVSRNYQRTVGPFQFKWHISAGVFRLRVNSYTFFFHFFNLSKLGRAAVKITCMIHVYY